MKELRVLNLENFSFPEDQKLLNLPPKVRSLTLHQLQLKSLPFDLNDCKESLMCLIVRDVRWPLVSECGGRMTLELFNEFAAEFYNQMSDKKWAQLFTQLDFKKKGYLDKDDILKLDAYIFKRFGRLRPTDTCPNGIPSMVFNLTNLYYLDLSYQAIRFVPDEIKSLVNLISVKFNYCIELESLSSNMGMLPIDQLELASCLSLKTPPPEIVKRGTDAVMAYLKRLLTGSVQCKRTKLMLVGLGEAGKTSLINSLIKSSSSSERPLITDGIEIKDWSIELEDKTNLTFSIWDFGRNLIHSLIDLFISILLTFLNI
jgi:leucine-rich repeat kinase 2